MTTDSPKSPLLDEAKFRMGICYTQLKRPKDAIRVLNELVSSLLAPARMIQVFTLMGDNYLELKDPFNALHWYGKGLLIFGQPKDELRGKVRSVIDTFDSEEAFIRVETLYRGAYAGGYAKLRLAQMAKRRGDTPLLKKIVSELEKEYQEMDYLPQAKELLGSLQIPEKSRYRVGVILPLSGIHQPFGTRVLQAIQLAMKEANSQEKTPLISLSIQDSKGNPKEAERVVEELISKERVVAIIGPLLSTNVDQAAKKAQQLKVPLITLSQKEPAYGKGDFVFQNSLTPLAQVQALAEFAGKAMELRTFAVIYPNSPYGLHYKNLFSQEITRRGGRVLGSIAYHEEQTDFSQEIKGFFKIKTTQEYDSRKKKVEEFTAGLTVDAIFIPDTHDRVSLILSQMAYFDITGSIFLGTNAWNDSRLISAVGTAAEKAVFVDCFYKRNPSPITTRFVDDFRKSYQRDPETLEAISYDSAKFLREILQVKSVSSPLQLKDQITRVENFQGVSGLTGFGEDGKAIRKLFLLTVKDGQIVPVQP
ncbi:MAG TPA: penicillin-binding protein activator [Thermodesulfobacteriota bacterium]|nr:penicillin-binding protein activator [Thermodesulfobacteriota bacterium]